MARSAGVALAAALIAAAGHARAQDKQDPPPVDINDVGAAPKPVAPKAEPAAKPADAKAPDAKAQDAKAEPAKAAAADDGKAAQGVVEGDGNRYRVGRFLIEWHTQHDQHPPADDLLNVEVKLAATPQGYVSPYELRADGASKRDLSGRPIPRGLPIVTVRLRDVAEGGETYFHTSALREVNQAIIDYMNRIGFIAVFSHPAEDMIDPEGADLRGGKTSDLRLIVWTGRIEEVRTIPSGERLESKIDEGKLSRVSPDDPVHNRIRAQSPVQTGDLVNRGLMDDFVYRLNRHPGRRVDVAVSPGSEPESVTLDYLVTESKPWTAYFQVSNTGTEQTSEWRERFGFVHNQLTKHDDVLALDYITGNFDASNTVTASYKFPLLSDRLALRAYGSYSEYDASEIGFSQENFSGQNILAGAELIGNIWQRKQLFLDAIGGIRWQDVKVDNTAVDQTGQDNFVEGYFGLNLERFTDDMASQVQALYYTNFDGLDPAQKDLLGRPDVDEYWGVIRFSAEQTAFMEPLFNRLGWFQGAQGKGFTSLANEVAISTRGQWAVTDDRLIPNEEEVAGGMFSVRGYKESLAAGDNVIVGTVEYRFHVPNYFAVSEPGSIGRYRMPSWAGKDFRWAPQQAFGRADWDLILKTFFDWGSVNQNNKQPGETPDTLLSVGVGAELLFRRNVSVRLDWGVALKAVGEINPSTGEADTQPGDNELHFMLTLSY
ncbi:MAG: ShlB/FhaC/HecB family hemolysin secretion/activation protein [Planctomycetes bacterium]|nr:ShlB/FhaC/HecB family hemolysin secretion/activation protein [Planctomycetota bacterium]